MHVVAPDNLVVRGADLRPGGATAAQVGSVNATLGADVRVQKRENGPVTLRGTANTVRGFYEFQGRRFTVQRGGTLQFNGLPQINPDIDVTAERLIPEHRRDRAHPHHRHGARAADRAEQHAAARRGRHPVADRLQPLGQRARAPASARRSPKPPAASPAASSRRRSAGRSARRSTSTSSRSRRRTTSPAKPPAA